MPRRAFVTTLLELIGLALIVTGFALIAPVCGVIVAGVALVAIGVTQA